MPNIILLGTCDTKLEELLFTREQILTHADTTVTLLDVGRTTISNPAITVSPEELATSYAPADAPSDISTLHRGQLSKHMAACATNYVRKLLDRQQQDQPVTAAIIGLGGSSGTSLSAAVMRDALPMGFPKLIVSTIASGETGPIVGETDITLMYSIVDIAGLNTILRAVLSNAAAAIAGMAHAYHQNTLTPSSQPNNDADATKKTPIRLGITMFGVTTPAVTAIRQHLATLSAQPAARCPYAFRDTHVFHATGHGGRAFERLARAGALDAAIDLTTTEVADHIVGGDDCSTAMSAGPTRLAAAAAKGIPQVVSLGATDMANFGARGSVPERFGGGGAGRRLFEHNASVTLMRTSADECARIGAFVAERLRAASRPDRVQVWVPRGGVSAMSVAGGVFEDAEADEALFAAVREGLEGSGVRVVEDARAINDEGFARAVVDALVGMLGEGKGESVSG
ncbi:hypothetical protein SLS58_008308 [Diplodia intermedia]|uniref:Uncharacterized protein n=1 Tax=Diplodia intermedia TaxID=856260 RepID=A0ABR3THY0_9PEZI